MKLVMNESLFKLSTQNENKSSPVLFLVNGFMVRFSEDGTPEALFNEKNECKPFMSLGEALLKEVDNESVRLVKVYFDTLYKDCPF